MLHMRVSKGGINPTTLVNGFLRDLPLNKQRLKTFFNPPSVSRMYPATCPHCLPACLRRPPSVVHFVGHFLSSVFYLPFSAGRGVDRFLSAVFCLAFPFGHFLSAVFCHPFLSAILSAKTRHAKRNEKKNYEPGNGGIKKARTNVVFFRDFVGHFLSSVFHLRFPSGCCVDHFLLSDLSVVFCRPFYAGNFLSLDKGDQKGANPAMVPIGGSIGGSRPGFHLSLSSGERDRKGRRLSATCLFRSK